METSMVGGMCRCCASEGAFKDVKTCYSWMGEDEVYADMLKDCFDIHLGSSSSGQYGGICEVCITQLRNAANFKKQVQQTEEQFKQLESRFFSTSIVKIEAPPDEDTIIHHDSDDNMHDSIDETFSANECEIKSEVPEEKPKKRARATTSRAAKKAKVGDPDTTVKRSTSKPRLTFKRRLITIAQPETKLDTEDKTLPTQLIDEKPEMVLTEAKTKESEDQDLNLPPKKNEVLNRTRKEMHKHCNNITEILRCTNATPIRKFSGIGYMCSYCNYRIPDPRNLKKHTINDHGVVETLPFLKHVTLGEYVIKLDITSLICKLCDTKMNTIEVLMSHLSEKHNKIMYTDINNHIIPFKFDTDELKCCICTENFSKFKMLLSHMNVHYKNYSCDKCEAGFINLARLRNHGLSHKTEKLKCNYCPKIFKNKTNRLCHEKAAHTKCDSLYKCCYCSETFRDYRKREAHLEESHGVQFAVAKCTACDKVYKNLKYLKTHVRKNHLMVKPHKCSECDMAFFGSNDLKHHMVHHTGIKKFQCDLCSKAYTSKYNLNLHITSHTGERKYKCEYCRRRFTQKCNLRRHLITEHGGRI